jgi:hypothetical protein
MGAGFILRNRRGGAFRAWVAATSATMTVEKERQA